MTSLNKNRFFLKAPRGSMLIVCLILTGLFLIIFLGAISLALLQQKLNIRKVAAQQAFTVAEAGANYYRWALYHNNKEYCNKEACIGAPNYGPYGPYSYTDSAGRNIQGHYELYITPPPQNGSTIVTIKSVGWVDKYPNVKKIVEVTCGIPSWASYAGLFNGNVTYGTASEVFGKVHSNGGVRMDGVVHNLVTSAQLNYNDGSGNSLGVHTHKPLADPAPNGTNPPNNVPDRPDVFMGGRNFPVTTVSFSLLDNYVNEVYDLATSSGLVLQASGGSNRGYHVILKTDNTMDIYKVTSVSGKCNNEYTERIDAETFYLSTTTPANGIVFIKDKVWIDGQINNTRITVLAFRTPFSGSGADIVINHNLKYTNYNGTDIIGLVSQGSILVGLYCDDNLRIDANMIAKTGSIGRRNYNGCATAIRSSLIKYGSDAVYNTSLGYANTSAGALVSGFSSRTYYYDSNSTFAPPPHFPTTGEYTFISWEEK